MHTAEVVAGDVNNGRLQQILSVDNDPSVRQGLWILLNRLLLLATRLPTNYTDRHSTKQPSASCRPPAETRMWRCGLKFKGRSNVCGTTGRREARRSALWTGVPFDHPGA